MASIIYINNNEQYGRNTASSQYFLQLARYLGIPVIAWNADNSGLDQEQVGRVRWTGPVAVDWWRVTEGCRFNSKDLLPAIEFFY